MPVQANNVTFTDHRTRVLRSSPGPGRRGNAFSSPVRAVRAPILGNPNPRSVFAEPVRPGRASILGQYNTKSVFATRPVPPRPIPGYSARPIPPRPIPGYSARPIPPRPIPGYSAFADLANFHPVLGWGCSCTSTKSGTPTLGAFIGRASFNRPWTRPTSPFTRFNAFPHSPFGVYFGAATTQQKLAVTTATNALKAAQAKVTAQQKVVTAAQSKVTADQAAVTAAQAKVATDQTAANAATGTAKTRANAVLATSQRALTAATNALSTAQKALTAAQNALATDQTAVGSAQSRLTAAQQTVDQANAVPVPPPVPVTLTPVATPTTITPAGAAMVPAAAQPISVLLNPGINPYSDPSLGPAIPVTSAPPPAPTPLAGGSGVVIAPVVIPTVLPDGSLATVPPLNTGLPTTPTISPVSTPVQVVGPFAPPAGNTTNPPATTVTTTGNTLTPPATTTPVQVTTVPPVQGQTGSSPTVTVNNILPQPNSQNVQAYDNEAAAGTALYQQGAPLDQYQDPTGALPQIVDDGSGTPAISDGSVNQSGFTPSLAGVAATPVNATPENTLLAHLAVAGALLAILG